jgi:arginase
MLFSSLGLSTKLNSGFRYGYISSSFESVLLKSRDYQYKNHISGRNKRSLSLGIIGAPFSKGQTKAGVELAPNAIRDAGLIKHLKLLGHDVFDFGDFNINANQTHFKLNNYQNVSNNKLKNEYMVAEMCSQLTPFVSNVAKKERIPITLGGDHSIAMGTVCGNASLELNQEMCVIWVDAHSDINTVSSTKSGNFHGMPVSFLLKEVKHRFEDPNRNCLIMQSIKPCISADNFAFIGLRDVESEEMNILNELKITRFSMRDIDKLGIFEIIARTLDKINPNLKKRIHVSFDIDSVDDMLAPSTGTPVPAGLTLREAQCIGEEIAGTKLLCGLDLVEVNPLIDNQNNANKTVNFALNIILSFLGKSRADLFARNMR